MCRRIGNFLERRIFVLGMTLIRKYILQYNQFNIPIKAERSYYENLLQTNLQIDFVLNSEERRGYVISFFVFFSVLFNSLAYNYYLLLRFSFNTKTLF